MPAVGVESSPHCVVSTCGLRKAANLERASVPLSLKGVPPVGASVEDPEARPARCFGQLLAPTRDHRSNTPRGTSIGKLTGRKRGRLRLFPIGALSRPLLVSVGCVGRPDWGEPTGANQASGTAQGPTGTDVPNCLARTAALRIKPLGERGTAVDAESPESRPPYEHTGRSGALNLAPVSPQV